MEDLIKVASNGQWILEKAKQTPPELQAMIDQYMKQKSAPAAPEPKKNPMEGLRPVQHATGANPAYSKEQVAAMRLGIPPEAAAAPSKVPTAVKLQVAQKVTAQMDSKQKEDDEKAKVSQGRKAAWEAGVAFLAQHGDKGFKALQQQMQQRKQLDTAHETGKLPEPVKPALLPPQKQGSFHNEGMTTSGKIVKKGFRYQDKETGEDRFGSVPQQEKHHWSWDHDKKKWNHIRTTFGSATFK